MTLTLRGSIKLPPHATGGGFDHGDVHAATGRLFIAHSSKESIEVVDGDSLRLERTVPGCPGASGVLCTQGAAALVFAAARGAGKVLVVDPLSCEVHREIPSDRVRTAWPGTLVADNFWWRTRRSTALAWSIRVRAPVLRSPSYLAVHAGAYGTPRATVSS